MSEVDGAPVTDPFSPDAPVGSGWTEEGSRSQDSLRCIAVARDHLNDAKRRRDEEQIRLADGRLHAAVETARNLGYSWGDISDVLGMARGNAYKRFRSHPADENPGDDDVV